MLVADFDYQLPAGLIAQRPLGRRDASRLLVLERGSGAVSDRWFSDIRDLLVPGDLLVLNDTRVIPARIFGRLPTGGQLELLLLRHVANGTWEALTRPARKARPGTVIHVGKHRATVLDRRQDGMRTIRFEPDDVGRLLSELGELALPPYIREQCHDPERYQTVYARRPGAVAAPTAGLHFTPELLAELRQRGVEEAYVTLHAGLGTFRPVTTDRVEDHTMHAEEFELTKEAAERVNRAVAEKRRVVCVGTTTVRVLEGQARRIGSETRVESGCGETSLFIRPGHDWKTCGAILTNFHLPRSTLLMLVSAFAGREAVLAAYRHAVERSYRFCSFGDAMFIC